MKKIILLTLCIILNACGMVGIDTKTGTKHIRDNKDNIFDVVLVENTKYGLVSGDSDKWALETEQEIYRKFPVGSDTNELIKYLESQNSKCTKTGSESWQCVYKESWIFYVVESIIGIRVKETPAYHEMLFNVNVTSELDKLKNIKVTTKYSSHGGYNKHKGE